MHCCTCSKWVHLKCPLLSSKFRTLGNSHSWSSPLLRPCFCWKSYTYQHCDFLLGLLQLVYLHCSIWLIWIPSANAALPLHPRLQTSYPPSAHFVFPPFAPSLPPLAPCCLSRPSASSSPPDSLRVLQWNTGGLRARGTTLDTFFHLIPLTLSVSRNLTLIHLPLSGSLDSLLCNLIAPTRGLAFSFLMPRMLVTSAYSSGGVYPPLFA